MNNAKCPKCNGTGKLPHYMNIDNGRCFMCAGVGTIKADVPSQAKILKMQAQYAVQGCVEEHGEYGNVRPAYIEQAAKALFALENTDLARRILQHVKPAVRSAIIAAGKALKS